MWRPASEARQLPFRSHREQLSPTSHPEQASELSRYREKGRVDAQRLIETKSRALKPSGPLPETLPLHVSIHVKGPRHRFTPEGELITEPESRLSMPLFEAARQSRRTLLLGDLGSGKSTLAGMFVSQTLRKNEQSLACIVPAKHLKPRQPLTVKELLRSVSEYFSEQISPTTPVIDLEILLNRRVEVSLVIDGLDEIPISQAAELLRQLGTLVEHWPNIQVMATGRPVELLGVSYEDWQVLSTIPLDDDQKSRLLEEEAIAEGKTESEAKQLARELLRKLKTLPMLHSLAVTPLVIRLLYSRLLSIQAGKTLSLGDLLYELTKERLGRWATKDAKQSVTLQFESAYPDEDSRASLLGKLALDAEMHKSMSVEKARLYLQTLLKSHGESNAQVLANEALHFFSQSGIVSIENELQFSIQPLFEFLCGYGLVTVWQVFSEAIPWLKRRHWRIVSFAATVLRRLGLIEDLRPRLLEFLQELLSDERNIPAASYIVSESQDTICAETFIAKLNTFGPRPLTLFYDDPPLSARTITEAIKLAGQAGFDWFFDHYLDPKYPIINVGSGIISDILEQWISLSIDNITDHEKARLSTVVRPHIAAGTFQLIDVIPLLALIVPDAFDLGEKLWLCGKFLGQGPFAPRTEQYLRGAFESGHSALTNDVLIKRARQGYESAASCAWLWVKFNDKRPPIAIVKTLVRARGSSRPDADLDECIDHCIRRIGQQSWEALLRWCLFEGDSHLAAGAAIELYNRGERRLPVLGEPLLGALHDGAYVRRAEEILSILIRHGGAKAVTWLAKHIAAMKNDMTGAHSGWWRIFLSELSHLGDDGPQLLVKSIGGIGCFLLPRYPEVRHLFRDLLTGVRGTDYRNALRERLDDINPAVRHGAAMALVVCDPTNESTALEVVVRSKSRESHGSWHEWERFCLSLSFGPSVLAYLESKLPTFDSSAEVFALAILNRNSIKLDPKRYERLVRGLLHLEHWALDPEEPKLSVLANSASFEPLVKAVETEINRDATRAAEKLLQYHSEKLTVPLHAKCASLAIAGGPWGLLRLHELISVAERSFPFLNLVEMLYQPST